ncbi:MULTISPECIES: serine/threonine-protein kinase [Tessaracoccus]|uniref:serine/threonine-protein kinase n=1 Tax=Tessaracoccus TaxID=72763 RepID=UPI00099C2E09|nr:MULTISPECIES: serine/threonine-protein kinase [Tessaracoccus]
MQRLRPGLVLADRYRLIGHVASGGMGQVWEAFDDVLERRVALKIMHPHSQDEITLAERFRDEARFAAQLAHPNIVTVFDYLDVDGLACLVMEYVDGPTLGGVLARGPLSADETRAILSALASGLAVAHEAGIIHRDIKPANVLVSDSGAKLTDFGIARSIDGGTHTMTGQVLGTAHYLSPEQALGQKVGPESDIYGLGVLAHEMLTGDRPFDRGTPIATALAHVRDAPPPLPEGTPEDLEAIITACLAKEPADRPTAAVVARLLEEPVVIPHDLDLAADPGDGPDPDATAPLMAVPRRAMVED